MQNINKRSILLFAVAISITWLYLFGSTTPFTFGAVSQDPKGNLDGIDGTGLVWGWAYDPDVPSQSIAVHIYVDGVFVIGFPTEVSRPDVNTAFGITGTHGFQWSVPSQYKNGVEHTLDIYAINVDSQGLEGGANLRIGSKKFTLSGATGSGTITVSKTYLGVSPTAADTEVKLDSGTFVSGNPAVFSNVSAGSHTITIEIPAGVKAFYATCTNATTCIAGFVDGGVGSGTGSGVKTLKTASFIHQEGKKDFVSVFYTSTDTVYTSQSFEFGLDDLLRVPKALAVTLVPTQVPWLDPIPNQPGQYALACARTFYVTDVVGDQGAVDGTGDLYAEASAALTAWGEAVNIQPIFGGTYFPQAMGQINGITTYKVLDELDGKNVIGYVDPALIGISGFVGVANTSGFGKTRGIVDFGTQTDIGLDATERFYIGNDGPAGWFHLPTTLKHELGHALGLGELDEAPLGTSIMTTPGKPTNFIQEITDNDIYTLNFLYESFLNQSCGFLPKKARLSVEFLANPAPLSGVSAAPACKGYPDAAWYKINTTIQEIGGVGVTLKNLLTSYYTQNNAQGTPLGTFTSPFSSFLQSAAGAKGFGSEKLIPFGNVTGTLCQVPWTPEQLNALFVKVEGIDDNGNEVSAANTISLNSSIPSSSFSMKGDSGTRVLLSPPAATFVLVPPSAIIQVGSTQQFQGIYNPTGDTKKTPDEMIDPKLILWGMTSPVGSTTIATIQAPGIYKGVAPGTVAVSGTYQNLTATAQLTVTKEPPPPPPPPDTSTFVIVPDVSTIKVGESVTLEGKYNPDGSDGEKPEQTVSGSNMSWAVPLVEGKEIVTGAGGGTFKGVAPGTVKVSGTVVAGGVGESKTASAIINVIEDLAIITTSIPEGVEGAYYVADLDATGGLAPLTWSFTGTLPPLLDFNKVEGKIFGTPLVGQSKGSWDIIVTAKDAAGTSVSKPFTLVIKRFGSGANQKNISILTENLPDAQLNQYYETIFSAEGGDPNSYYWSMIGNLPEGVKLYEHEGKLAGTPTKTGIYRFILQVSDALGNIATKNLQLIVQPLSPRLRITPENASVKVGEALQLGAIYDPDGSGPEAEHALAGNESAWQSSDSSIATVTNGLVNGNKPDNVRIITAYHNLSAQTPLTVVQAFFDCRWRDKRERSQGQCTGEESCTIFGQWSGNIGNLQCPQPSEPPPEPEHRFFDCQWGETRACFAERRQGTESCTLLRQWSGRCENQGPSEEDRRRDEQERERQRQEEQRRQSEQQQNQQQLQLPPQLPRPQRQQQPPLRQRNALPYQGIQSLGDLLRFFVGE